MRRKFPYYPYYVKDIEGDPVVMAMNLEQFGAYQHLLNAAWQEDEPGTLPDDDDCLADFARVKRQRWVKLIKPKVMKAFRKGEDGRWHQKKMKAVYAELCSLFERSSNRGKKGAAKRWEKSENGCLSNAQAMLKHSSAANAQGITPAFGFEFGFKEQSESKSTGDEGCGGKGIPGRPPGQSLESRLATLWLFFLKGPRNKATELSAVTEIMAELLRKGTPFEQIESWITDKSRDWSEPIWTFKDHWKAKPGKAKQSTSEMVSELEKFISGGK